MIDSKECQLGNYVLFNPHKDVSRYCVVKKIEEESITVLDMGLDLQLFELEFQPVPITPTLLNKIEGFELSPDKTVWFIGHHGFCLEFDGEDYCLKMRANEPYLICYVRHLHQLQNLYKLLINKDLIIHI